MSANDVMRVHAEGSRNSAQHLSPIRKTRNQAHLSSANQGLQYRLQTCSADRVSCRVGVGPHWLSEPLIQRGFHCEITGREDDSSGVLLVDCCFVVSLCILEHNRRQRTCQK